MTTSEIAAVQRITRLTPLGAILALIDSRVDAVAPRQSELAAALGAVLAEDVAASMRPPQAIALRDGFPVESAAVADAGPYAPVTLPAATLRIDAGEALPNGADAVLPLDAATRRGGRLEAIAAVPPGEGILPAGGDAAPDRPLRRAGKRVRAVDVAAMRAAGVAQVMIRAPRIVVVRGGEANAPVIDAALEVVIRAAVAAGAIVADRPHTLQTALADEDLDAVIAIGGTGSGRRDAAVQTLARLGRVEAHGIAVSPGETAAFGFAGARPVLLVPGRLDAALTIWLLVGSRLLARLAGGSAEDMSAMLPLARKVTSTIGLAELIPVACAGGMAEPLGGGYLSFEALGRSDGWIVIAADSEGFAAGTPVTVRAWP